MSVGDRGWTARVVVFDPIPGDWSFEPERSILGGRGVDLLVPESAAAADEAIRDADAVIVTGIRRLDADRVAALRDPAGILCYSIGTDKVDPSAAAAGIPVRNVPDYCTDEVSDHALTLLLAAERDVGHSRQPDCRDVDGDGAALRHLPGSPSWRSSRCSGSWRSIRWGAWRTRRRSASTLALRMMKAPGDPQGAPPHTTVGTVPCR